MVKAPLQRLAAAAALLAAQPGVHWVTLHSSPRAANFYGTAVSQCGAAESTYDVANLANSAYTYNDEGKHPLWAAGLRVSNLHIDPRTRTCMLQAQRCLHMPAAGQQLFISSCIRSLLAALLADIFMVQFVRLAVSVVPGCGPGLGYGRHRHGPGQLLLPGLQSAEHQRRRLAQRLHR